MFCSNCGQKIPDGSAVCPVCGAPAVREEDIELTENAAAAAAAPEEPAAKPEEILTAETTPDPVQAEAHAAAEEKEDGPEQAVTIPAETGPKQQETEPSQELQPEKTEETDTVHPEELSFSEMVPGPERTVTEEQTAVPDLPAEVKAEDEEPETAAVRDVEAPITESRGSGGGKAAAIILVVLALLAGGFLIYRNLPESKFKRYMKSALESYTTGDYTAAAESYYKALEIHPDSEEALMNIEDMYETVKDRALAASAEGRFEDSVNESRTLFRIKPDAEEDNLSTLESAYGVWTMYLVKNGTKEDVEELIGIAQQELPSESITKIRKRSEEMYHLMDLESQMTEIADTVRASDSIGDVSSVFHTLENVYSLMSEYRESGGALPFAALDEGGLTGVEFNMDSKDNIQIYIGELASGRVKTGNGRTYYISGIGTSGASYEFFEASWQANDPNGAFVEMDYGSGPDSAPTGILSGVLYNGFYNGAIKNTRGELTYNMSFSYGKVEVLDTTDRNGDRNNVVGYTEDKNNWLVFSDSALNGKYGVRYLR